MSGVSRQMGEDDPEGRLPSYEAKTVSFFGYAYTHPYILKFIGTHYFDAFAYLGLVNRKIHCKNNTYCNINLIMFIIKML